MRTLRRAIASVALSTAALTPAAAQVGELDFVDSVTPLADSVLESVGDLLPELPNAGAAFTDPRAETSLLLDQDGQVEVVFVWESTDYVHTLGYFTYTESPLTIVDRQLVFPKASLPPKGKLQTGDTVTLRAADGSPRTFTAGTRIGFFLVADGHKAKAVKKWDATLATTPSVDPAENALVGKGTYATVDGMNPEVAEGRDDRARHAALLWVPDLLGAGQDAAILGFEASDRTDRSCDHDFNDVTFLVRSAAIDPTGVFAPDAGDPDADGVRGTHDAYPDDAARAQVTRSPSSGFHLLGLDDPYPATGDHDFNDAVIAAAFDLVTDVDDGVTDVRGDLHLVARGGQADHRLGLHMPGIPGGTDGLLRIERYLGDDAHTLQVEADLTVADLITLYDRIILCLMPSTGTALPPIPFQIAINTETDDVDRLAASARMVMNFDTAVDRQQLGPPPFDLHFWVDTGQGLRDVHMAGYDAFSQPAGLPVETGVDAYHDDESWPWILDMTEAGRFPREASPFHKAYGKFLPWAASRGVTKPDWFHKASKSRVSADIDAYLRNQPWAIDLPAR